MLPIDQIVEDDALEFLKKLPSNSVDLVLTDPPFFMPAEHYQSRIKYQRNFADLSPLKVFWDVVTKEVVRALKKTGHFITFCNCDSYPVFYIPMYNSFDKLNALIWDKKRVGLGNIWRHQHEMIIAARFSESKINENGKLYSDVIAENATLSADREHPVEKPWELLMQLIEPITYPGDLIVDPFCGSGTTCLAAQVLNRRYIGVDLNGKYVEVARQKLTHRPDSLLRYISPIEATHSEFRIKDEVKS